MCTHDTTDHTTASACSVLANATVSRLSASFGLPSSAVVVCTRLQCMLGVIKFGPVRSLGTRSYTILQHSTQCASTWYFFFFWCVLCFVRGFSPFGFSVSFFFSSWCLASFLLRNVVDRKREMWQKTIECWAITNGGGGGAYATCTKSCLPVVGPRRPLGVDKHHFGALQALLRRCGPVKVHLAGAVFDDLVPLLARIRAWLFWVSVGPICGV